MPGRRIYPLLFSLMMTLCVHAQTHSCQNGQHGHSRGMSDYYSFENLRSDSLDILQYAIDLDMTMMNSQQISASCTVDFQSRMNNISIVHLDLLNLIVDSVSSANGNLNFQHTGSDLYITLPSALNTGDSYSFTVHYHGHPIQDVSWGGFYFSLGYAFNLGVAFTDYPHNYGRVWFPCFDNFVERSRFKVNVLTNGGRTAYCGGVQTGVESVGTDSLLTRWVLDREIPSYLASVSVANYTHVHQSFESVSGDEIPIWLAAKASDTTDFKQSLINLVPCLQGFEQHYGPYRWPRVGYVAVPFSGGAMEHATNIAYPGFAINGNLADETLYAHELSHHWWGDLVTCRTAEDMWLNEGWASYSEALFKEVIYGQEAYVDYVKTNHKNVLLHAHEDDGGWYAVSGIPYDLTYGSTVYQKGADMVHNLRGYMGTAAFFNAIQAFLEDHQYSDVSSEDLRDAFQPFTSANLNSFFDNWIFAAGFPEFRVASYTSNVVGNDHSVQISIEQFQHHTDEWYSDVPITITVMDEDFNIHEETAMVSGQYTTVNITSPVSPDYIILNRDQKLNYAVLAEEKIIKSTGTNNFLYAEMEMNTADLGSADSIWIRVENHWAPANVPALIPFTDYYISPDRWWLVEGNIPLDANITGKIKYYGNDGQTNYFDPLFFAYLEDHGMTENNIILLYRASGDHPWEEWTNYVVNTTGSATNWAGRIDISNLKTGQYAWAVHTGTIGVQETGKVDTVRILRRDEDHVLVFSKADGLLHLYDGAGKIAYTGQVKNGTLEIDLSRLAQGKYILQLNNYSVALIK